MGFGTRTTVHHDGKIQRCRLGELAAGKPGT